MLMGIGVYFMFIFEHKKMSNLKRLIAKNYTLIVIIAIIKINYIYAIKFRGSAHQS